MTNGVLEAGAIMAVLGVGIPVLGFLIALALTLREKNRRKAQLDAATDLKNRQNGKHKKV